jgi:hypothetical protein
MQSVDQVHLQLHNDKPVYSIAEMLRPRLQIRNGSDKPVTFGNGFIFDWETLFFAPPNAVHLIDPTGRDLAGSYKDGTHVPHNKPLTVMPGGEESLFLPIYAFFHLRTTGKYRFWVELGDDRGGVHTTNVVEFELIDVEASAQPGSIVLTLSSPQRESPVNDPVIVSARFANGTSHAVTILHPQQDSFYGWVNPVYQFTVLDSGGRSLPLAVRSGTMALPHYDETTRTTIPPGAVSERTLRLPDVPLMRHAGEYRVSLTYIVRRTAVGKAGAVLDKPENWLPDVFVGRLESPELRIRVQ